MELFQQQWKLWIKTIEVIEKHIPSGYPTDAGAVLLVEVEGLVDGVEMKLFVLGK